MRYMRHNTNSARPEQFEMDAVDIETTEVFQPLAAAAWKKMQSARLQENAIGQITWQGFRCSFGKNRFPAIQDSHFDICISSTLNNDYRHSFILIRKSNGVFTIIEDTWGHNIYNDEDEMCDQRMDKNHCNLLVISTGSLTTQSPDQTAQIRKKIRGGLMVYLH
jgi:hypothetical protein